MNEATHEHENSRNFTKSRVTQGGSLLKVLRCSQAECSALLFKVRSLLWLYVVVFAFPFMVRYGRIYDT